MTLHGISMRDTGYCQGSHDVCYLGGAHVAEPATMLPGFLLRLNHMERYHTVTLYVHLAVISSMACL